MRRPPNGEGIGAEVADEGMYRFLPTTMIVDRTQVERLTVTEVVPWKRLTDRESNLLERSRTFREQPMIPIPEEDRLSVKTTQTTDIIMAIDNRTSDGIEIG